MLRLFSSTAEKAFVNPTKKYATSTNELALWKGKVRGEPEEIQEALELLGRKPKDAEELDKLIRDQRRASLREELQAAAEGFKIKAY